MLEKVPAELKSLRSWVLWKTIVRDGSPTKLPFQVSGAPAKSNDATTWNTFESACKACSEGGYSGLGFVFSTADSFCGIDLDGCRDAETGTYSDWAKTILARFNSYSEISPSRTGVKIFVRGSSPWGAGKKFPVVGADMSCGKEPAIEVYDSGRYFAVTGLRIGNLSQSVEERQEALNWLAEAYGPKKTPVQSIVSAPHTFDGDGDIITRARAYLAKVPTSISGQGGHNAAMRAACSLVIGFGLSESEALPLMREWNAGCQPPWQECDLVRKVSEAMKQPGERNALRNATREMPGRDGFRKRAGVRQVLELARTLDRNEILTVMQGLLSELQIHSLDK